jgi:hypothetical protein
MLVAKATEFFGAYLANQAKRAMLQEKRKQLQCNDLGNYFTTKF